MGKMEAIAPDSLRQHSGECPYAGLGTWGYLAMNAGTGALRASDLSLGLLPLLPNLPDLPSTFLDNQKFHSLWCLLSKTPRAEKSPPLIPMFGGCGMPCLVLVGSSRPCGSVCSASITHAGYLYPRLPSSHVGNVVMQAPWKHHCTAFGNSFDFKDGCD